MLILTRREGESLMIGDDVKITVLGIRGNQVRVGVDAPRDIAVHRQEIYERIQEENAGKSRSVDEEGGNEEGGDEEGGEGVYEDDYR